MSVASKIKFGDNLDVTDEGSGVIRVDATGGGASAADDVSNTPAGSIAATDVQAAINELDSEKAALSALGSLATLSTITTTEITDGTIVNADIAAAAAIADTKISALRASRETLTATGSGFQNLWTYSLPANTLGTTKGIRIVLVCRRTTGSGNGTYRPSFGGTTMAPLGAVGTPTKFEIYVWGDGATNAQRFDTYQWSGTTNGHTTGALAIDQTSPVSITFDVDLATDSDVFTMDFASVEFLG